MSDFLKQIFQNTTLNESELVEIQSFFEPQTFSKNSFLIENGKVAHSYWYLEKGYIRSFTYDTEANDISTGFYAPNDLVIDWTSFFLKLPARENLQCLTDCVVWEINFEDFQYLFNKYEAFREMGRSSMVQSYFELKSNSISMIADSAKDRYLKLIETKPYLLQNVSLKHLASYLGITDTSLSRIRKEIVSQS